MLYRVFKCPYCGRATTTLASDRVAVITCQCGETLKKYVREDDGDDNEVMAELDVHRLGVIMETHARAMACHCECLAMNAENSVACCENRAIPYSDDSYLRTLRKWGLISDIGEPLI